MERRRPGDAQAVLELPEPPAEVGAELAVRAAGPQLGPHAVHARRPPPGDQVQQPSSTSAGWTGTTRSPASLFGVHPSGCAWILNTATPSTSATSWAGRRRAAPSSRSPENIARTGSQHRARSRSAPGAYQEDANSLARSASDQSSRWRRVDFVPGKAKPLKMLRSTCSRGVNHSHSWLRAEKWRLAVFIVNRGTAVPDSVSRRSAARRASSALTRPPLPWLAGKRSSRSRNLPASAPA